MERRFSVLEIAQALVTGDAVAPARDLLVNHLKTSPNHRAGWRLLTQIDIQTRGEGSAATLWSSFLRRFPADVPALRQLAQIQQQNAQLPQALKTLQQIPGEELDEATLHQIATLAIQLDDLPAALRAQQLIVQSSKTPAVSDVVALADLTRQQADAEADAVLAESLAKLPAGPAFQQSLIAPPATSVEATGFSTAVQPK
jgi:predicted Zn-dependent protease